MIIPGAPNIIRLNEKPKPWGRIPDVQQTVRYNVSRMGLDRPPVLLMPSWEGGGDKVYDLSGQGNDGTNNGGTWDSYGLNLDGASNYVNVSDSASLDATTELSIFTFIKSDSVGAADGLVAKYDSLVLANQRSYIMMGLAGKLRFVGSADGTANNYFVWLSSSVVILQNTVQFVGIVCKDGEANVDMYVDGVEVSSAFDSSVGAVPSLYQGTAPLNLGAAHSGTSNFFEGTVWGTIVFDHALTPAQVATLHADSYGLVRQPPRPLAYVVPVATTPTPTTLPPTTLAPTTPSPTTLAPTTIGPTTIAPTTLPPTTITPTTSLTTAPPPPVQQRGIRNFGFSMRDNWR